MNRFNIKKGDRFNINKSAGLTHIKVHLGWQPGVDLDASAFLLGDDGTIMNDADFVFYNSENREQPFDKTVYGNKRKWREQTRPMSADSSVLGSIDERGTGEVEVDGEKSEEMHVDLDKVDGKITEIVFCATIADEGKVFSEAKSPYIAIYDEDKDEELCYYDLDKVYSKENAAAIASLVCDDEGEWSFVPLSDKGYEGGIETLIDIYAS